MDIIVCLKRTINVSQLTPNPETGAPELELAPYQISDFDENAMEEAVRLKEKHGGKVTVVTASPSNLRDVLPKALAMGADDALAIVDESVAGLDSLGTARLIAECIKRKAEGFGLIICGEGSVDEYNLQLGPRLAEELSIPCVTYVTKLEVRDGSLWAERSLEDRTECVAAPLPVLVTVGMEINNPRYVSLLRMMAVRKPVVEVSLDELVLAERLANGLTTISIKAPKSLRKCLVFEGSLEEATRRLVEALLEDGVIRA